MGTIDPGSLVISGRLKNGVALEQAEDEVNKVVGAFKDGISNEELDKVKAQAESSMEFGEVEVMNRAMNLAFAKLSGDASLVNREGKLINEVSLTDIKRCAREILREENSGVMYYRAKKAS
jgi:zinc protease